MRFWWCLALVLVLPASAHAEAALCEYRHPDHPAWDFLTDCQYEASTRSGATTYEVEVSNGSKFTAVEGLAASVNGKAAVMVEQGESHCFRTQAELELVCIHPTGAASAAPSTTPVPAANAQLGIGGGQAGFCLLAQTHAGAMTLTDHGACVRRENCLEDATGRTTCLADFTWKNGRVTEMARAEGWQTLDGADAKPGKPGCFLDEQEGVEFCFSRVEMTPAQYPVLAAGSE